MKISIVTAVYNNAVYIETCILSVLNQSYANIEFVVVDGGSTDGTLEIISKYKQRIGIIISEPDNGIYEALNKGIRATSGDVIGLLHSDDFFYSTAIVEQIALTFAENEEIRGTYGDLLYVNKTNTDQIIRYWKSSAFDKSMLRKGWMPPHPTLFLAQSLIAKVGTYNTAYKIAADYDFMIRTLSSEDARSFKYIPTIITCMRTGGASNKSLKNIFRKSIEDYRIIRLNNVGGWYTLFLKNFSKVGQLFKSRNETVKVR